MKQKAQAGGTLRVGIAARLKKKKLTQVEHQGWGWQRGS